MEGHSDKNSIMKDQVWEVTLMIPACMMDKVWEGTLMIPACVLQGGGG